MKRLSDFDFKVPVELVAQHPMACRNQSRLMVLNHANPTDQVGHYIFSDLPNLLDAGDLLIFNESKVIPARFFGRKKTGGRVECLLERILDNQTAVVHLKSNHSIAIGTEIILDNHESLQVMERVGNLFEVHLNVKSAHSCWKMILEEIGTTPLPVYIQRSADLVDSHRYQTVYAKHEGSVAAPTAGLHFDEPLLEKLKEKGIHFAFLTLHVGAGTFQPVRSENIEEHQMHQEWIHVPLKVCEQIATARACGKRVIAVGTTSVRAIETAAQMNQGQLSAYMGPTRLFIYPGYHFSIINGLITNFHVPKSSLLMLVSAFAGYEYIKNAYQIAVVEKYRFFSYGDGMLILGS